MARARLTRFVTGIVGIAIVSAMFAIVSPMASAATISQSSPFFGTTDVAGSTSFTATLEVSGNTGAVTFTPNGQSSPPGLQVSSSGVISNSTSGTLAPNTYTISGADSDTSNDAGTWTYSLTVTTTIQQGSPESGTVDVENSLGFTDTLAPASGYPGPLTYTSGGPSSPAGLQVSSSGVISNSTSNMLDAGTYTISGSDSDGDGDTGSWTYTLTVTKDTIIQGGSTSNTVSVRNSATFSDSLSATPGFSDSVTYLVTNPSSPTGLVVSGAGAVTTSGTLAVATYTISGTDSDTFGDTGTWSYSLSVTPSTITQGTPTSGSSTTTNSQNFSVNLSATPGFVDSVTYLVTNPSSPSGLDVSSTGAVTTSGTLGPTTYTISGTDSDSYGDAGTWTFSLTVLPVGSKTILTQTSSTSGTVTDTESGSFIAGPITVENNVGPVTFVTTKTSTSLTVSSSGAISTSGPLSIGTYSVSGSDSDPDGDTGTWTYTLTVTGVVVTVTFDANGGSGNIAPESESEPTALTLNTFTWTGHTFVDWNTSANGSGVSYANGAVFPFSASTTLFAQWKTGKVTPHTVTFKANGGTGSMSPETDNTPTGLSANRFTRAGYTFSGWNTSVEGTGKSFKAGATYSFKESITLFAQWKKIPARALKVVTFLANGGTGVMPAEQHRTPSNLDSNRFTRSGFSFVGWNTAPNGSGHSYGNRALFPFSNSAVLYAQWKKVKKVVPPPTKKTGPTVGPFALRASTLNANLESQVENIAEAMKTKGDTQVILLGYGDELSAKDDGKTSLVTANIELGRMRAQAAATYLEGRLAALGLKGWTISIAAANASASNSSGAEAGLVIATLT